MNNSKNWKMNKPPFFLKMKMPSGAVHCSVEVSGWYHYLPVIVEASICNKVSFSKYKFEVKPLT